VYTTKKTELYPQKIKEKSQDSPPTNKVEKVMKNTNSRNRNKEK
jgi:hypothetical protein